MRRGQTAVEIPIALLLLVVLALGGGAAAVGAWRAADAAIAREAARSDAQRGAR